MQAQSFKQRSLGKVQDREVISMSNQNFNDLSKLKNRIEQLEERLSSLVKIIAAINKRIHDNNK